jgi:hypothetical protein
MTEKPRHPGPATPDTTPAEELFPSGPWTGFFLQPVLPGRHWMELNLTFANGTIRGEGRDWVSEFVIVGKYESDTGKCWFTKRYLGRHDVAYLGYNEGRGIWGTWEMSDPAWKGGFHIWPEGMDIGIDRRMAREADLPGLDTGPVSFEDQEVETLEPAGIGVD